MLSIFDEKSPVDNFRRVLKSKRICLQIKSVIFINKKAIQKLDGFLNTFVLKLI